MPLCPCWKKLPLFLPFYPQVPFVHSVPSHSHAWNIFWFFQKANLHRFFFPLPLNLLYHMMQYFTHLAFFRVPHIPGLTGLQRGCEESVWYYSFEKILLLLCEMECLLESSVGNLEDSHISLKQETLTVTFIIYYYGCRETCESCFPSCPFCLKCNLCCRVWTSFLQRGWGLSWSDQSYRTSLQVWGQLYSSCKWMICCIFLSKTESEKCRFERYQAKF